MFFVFSTGAQSELSRRPWVTIGLALTCVGVFAVTAMEESPGGKVDLSALEAEVDERPWLLGTQLPPAELAQAEVTAARRDFDARLGQTLDLSGGLQRSLSLVPNRGVAQVGWLTNLFVHFDLFHLLGNLFFLWLVGPLLEEAWGKSRFGAFYLLAGLAASATQFLLSTKSLSSIGGASGAIAGCMGAFAVRFAFTRIRFVYFAWLLRLFWGSFTVPAWAAGVFWFGREVLTLSDGGASGVATGAHVGGFVAGSMVALGMKALGWERAFKTVSETSEERAALDGSFHDAQESMRLGDYDGARAQLQQLLTDHPSYPGAERALAEAEVRGRRGTARLEKLLRPRLAKLDDGSVDALLTRLWPDLEAQILSDAFAWAVIARLKKSHRVQHASMLRGLLQKVAAGTGRNAVAARQELAATPDRAGDPPPTGPSGTPDSPEMGPTLDLEERSAEAAPRLVPIVMGAQLKGLRREGLDVLIDGRERTVKLDVIKSIEAAVVNDGGRKVLLVDVVLRVPDGRAPTALRLAGADPAVPALFPGRPVPEAWSAFVLGLRKLVSPDDSRAAWAELATPEALTMTWR